MIAQIVLENAWAWGIGLPLVLAVVLLYVRVNRRQSDGWLRNGMLAGSRLLALLILVLLVSRPVRVLPETEQAARDRIAVLIDRSESMSLESENGNRWRQAVEFLRSDFLPAVKSAGLNVDAYLFAEQVIPRRAAVTTEEAANVAAFLLSPRSSGINAAKIVVDAGMSINYFDDRVIRGTLDAGL